MRTDHVDLFAAALTVILATVSPVSASVPATMTEQGRLFDTAGNPVTGTSATFVFSIYSVATGGTAIWTETQTISLDAGFFSAELGEVTPIPAGTFADAAGRAQNLYLGIKVNADSELTPRQPLSSVPYALVADNAIGDITPHSVSVNGQTVINASGAWVGPAPSGTSAGGPVGIMQTGVAMGGVALSTTQSSVIPSYLAYRTYVTSLTLVVPASATRCFVTVTGNYCGDPGPNDGVGVAVGSGGAALADFNNGLGACFLSPRISGSNCSSCTTTQVINVAGGGSYQFGCDVTGFAAPVASGGTAGCQASALCF
jgi:hypothetical protein